MRVLKKRFKILEQFDFTGHDARRLRAESLVLSGGIKKAQDVLGHSSAKLTVGYAGADCDYYPYAYAYSYNHLPLLRLVHSYMQ